MRTSTLVVILAAVPASCGPAAPPPPAPGPGPSHSFLVVDDEGEPLPGATVQLVYHDHTAAAGSSDAKGMASVPVASVEGNATPWVVVSSPGLVRVCVDPIRLTDHAPGERYVAHLAASVVVTGTLRDATTGAALSGGRIVVLPSRDDEGETDCTLPPKPGYAQGTSAADGSFAVAGAPRDAAYEVRIDAAGHVPAVFSVTPPATLAADVRLAPAVALRGIVRDAAGHAVAGAVVTAAFEEDDEPARTVPPAPATSSADGSYLLDGLAPGRSYRISAACDGYLDEYDEEPLDVAAGAAAPPTRDVTLHRAVTLTLRVTGPGGTAVADARVTVDSPGSMLMGRLKHSPFDVHPGTVTVTIDADGYAKTQRSVDVEDDAPETLEIELRPAK